MTPVKQISVFVENKHGKLSSIARHLADNGVSIRALCMADTTDFGIFRLIASDYEAAEKALKAAGVTCSVTEVLVVEIEDTPGAFADAMALLADNEISLEYVYAFLTPEKGKAYIIIRVEDNAAAAKVLHDGGIKIVSQDEIKANA